MTPSIETKIRTTLTIAVEIGELKRETDIEYLVDVLSPLIREHRLSVTEGITAYLNSVKKEHANMVNDRLSPEQHSFVCGKLGVAKNVERIIKEHLL